MRSISNKQCRITSGELYACTEVKGPAFRHIIELNALLKGIELHDEDVNGIIRGLATRISLSCPLIDKGKLKDTLNERGVDVHDKSGGGDD